jgi:Methyltransferase domain
MPAAPSGPWFNAVARYLGPAYLRNAFTKGTEQEVAFLVDALELDRGERVLDVGCGPGRHALALARGGIDVVGVDLSEDFITLARDAAEADVLPARFEVGDVASLRTTASSTPSSASAREDSGSSVAATNPGPSSASPPHSVPVAGSRSPRFQPPSPSASSRRGRASTPPPVLHERSTVRNEDGEEKPFDLWTTCFTARELKLLAGGAGLEVVGVHGVAPGRYETARPTLDDPELLLLARRHT